MSGVTVADYQAALVLIDEGTQQLAQRYRDSGLSAYKATLAPREHADLALRLAQALSDDGASA